MTGCPGARGLVGKSSLALFAALIAAFSEPGRGETCRDRPIRMVVPADVGSNTRDDPDRAIYCADIAAVADHAGADEFDLADEAIGGAITLARFPTDHSTSTRASHAPGRS